VAHRQRNIGLDAISAMPWPAGIILGLTAFAAIRYGIPWYLANSGSDLATAFGKGLAGGPILVFSWLALVMCWLAACMSFFRQRQRALLFDTQARHLELSALNWRDFERLVAEWFHRQGFQVEESGGGGPDGGLDLILRKDGRTEIVQCKHWRRRQVSVTTVREMWGLLAHHKADAVWIVCTGTFTPDAAAFAAGKPIRLVTGAELGAMIQPVAGLPARSAATEGTTPAINPCACPKCGRNLVERRNGRTGESFLGCETYPSCRGTRPMQ
jgi:restriction system protein